MLGILHFVNGREKNWQERKLGRKDLIKALQRIFKSTHTPSPSPPPCLRAALSVRLLRQGAGERSINVQAKHHPSEASTSKRSINIGIAAVALPGPRRSPSGKHREGSAFSLSPEVCSRGQGFYPSPKCRAAEPTARAGDKSRGRRSKPGPAQHPQPPHNVHSTSTLQNPGDTQRQRQGANR